MGKVEVKTVLILGSGPIVIGQACEFDYSGTQACQALKEEGVRVVLLNSNPATIMTDPGLADRTYIEPMTPVTVLDIIRKEAVDAILPTMGGQTGLNLVTAMAQIPGALDGVKIIGANLKAIHLAEDRRAFREVVQSLGMDTPRSSIVRSLEECRAFAAQVGFPFILRPSFTLGGTGQSFVYSESELVEKTETALFESPIAEALVEESVLGWKEYELEVMRDRLDNAIVVCSIENLDPMGVHTGDSVTVAPQQTLTDREYQEMRFDALRLVRRIGVETGGCNVQFGVHPKTGRRVVIEMNPRVSRSSALASKATGFPIAFVATKLALGYALSEIPNNVTKTTMACFEPPLDYVALKIPRWHFEKFEGAQDILLPQMQSVGEVLAFGASFGEAYHKALISLERKWPIFEPVDSKNPKEAWDLEAKSLLTKAYSKRAYAVWDALATGYDPELVAAHTGFDPWFTRQIRRYQNESGLGARATDLNPKYAANFEMIDTCAGERDAQTPYFYSTREPLSRSGLVQKTSITAPNIKGRVVILGSGPNRIGQGVEFDYCCVHASISLQKLGYETIMVNCNPETVSTDPNVSTRLYLEPLTEQSVLAILERELSPVGDKGFVLLQTGGQTPLKLAQKIEEWGFQILGTSKRSIDLCEDRAEFAKLLSELNVPYPDFAEAKSFDEALHSGRRLGYPILVRPSFVLGGRAMRICANESDLAQAYAEAREVSEEHPLYLDRFLVEAVEFDIDGVCDGTRAWVAGVMEHVEEAGIHSGDSSCIIPPFRLPPSKIDEMAALAKKIAVASGAKGLFNIQMAVLGDRIFVIEANPRASRTVPFLSKATGYPVLEWGVRAALGERLEDMIQEVNIPGNYRLPSHGYAVKTPVFPFHKFKNVDPMLGPEMRSTGEVMGMDASVGGAFAKAFLAAGLQIPVQGRVLFSVRDQDKPRALNVARMFSFLGFSLYGTPGTASYLNRAGIFCESTEKIGQNLLGDDLLDLLQSGRVSLVVNTTETLSSLRDGVTIRKAALKHRIPLFSTVSGAEMAGLAIQALRAQGIRPVALQDFVAAARKQRDQDQAVFESKAPRVDQ
jgi:carbamoyl-phosphate synthase large subunit